jgi:hypothetical protein
VQLLVSTVLEGAILAGGLQPMVWDAVLVALATPCLLQPSMVLLEGAT